jgi:hypothetical protein
MSVSNPFDSSGGNLTGLVPTIGAVTPSDSADLPKTAVGIKCKGTAGNVVFVSAGGDTITYPIAADEVLVCGISRILSTGTTATTLWAFYA